MRAVVLAYHNMGCAGLRALKRHGFVFVGPTTMYAAMQAMGLVDDHLQGCTAARGAG